MAAKRCLRLLVLLQIVVLAGCAAYPYTPYPPRVSPALGEMRGEYASIEVLYATDRRATGVDSPQLFYGVDRAKETQRGECRVSIPPHHGRGRIESPVGLLPARPERHVAVTSIMPNEQRAEFVAALQEAVSRSERRSLFLFVHGYYCSFYDAARRTGQIAHDADFDGAAVAYSWPSEAWLVGYLIDGVNAEWTVPHLVEFLKLVADESGAEHIYILAHSMGTRTLTAALKEFARQRQPGQPPAFDHVVLAAADIDAEIFERDYAEFVAATTRRLTLYVSGADWALGGSRRLHKYQRLGQSGLGETDAQWVAQTDVVDVTAVDKGVVGHLYYADSPTVLEDLAGILRGETAEQRELPRPERMYVLERAASE